MAPWEESRCPMRRLHLGGRCRGLSGRGQFRIGWEGGAVRRCSEGSVWHCLKMPTDRTSGADHLLLSRCATTSGSNVSQDPSPSRVLRIPVRWGGSVGTAWRVGGGGLGWRGSFHRYPPELTWVVTSGGQTPLFLRRLRFAYDNVYTSGYNEPLCGMRGVSSVGGGWTNWQSPGRHPKTPR